MSSSGRPLVPLIRAPGAADVPVLVAMLRALAAQQGDPTDIFDRAAAERDFLGDPAFVRSLLAEVDAVPARLVAWHPSYEPAYAARGGYVVAIWVEPGYRRQGIATRLLEAAAARVRSDGGVYLWWASKPWNRDAHATYAAWRAGSEPVVAHALTYDAFLDFAGRPDQPEQATR